jgi:hypothetical protein
MNIYIYMYVSKIKNWLYTYVLGLPFIIGDAFWITHHGMPTINGDGIRRYAIISVASGMTQYHTR